MSTSESPDRMNAFRRELRPMLLMAAPLALAEVGWMSMSLVDTVMVGHLPHAAVPLSAAALAQVLYNTLAFGVGGVLLGLDTTIAQAHGAGDYSAANRWLWQGLLLCAAISALLMVLYGLAPLGLRHLPMEHDVYAAAIPTLEVLSLGTLPLMITFTLRRYLQAFNHVRVIAAALVSANLINLAFDWLLIFGHSWQVAGHTVAWSAKGVVGSGIATALARLYQAVFSVVALMVLNRRNRYGLSMRGLRPQWASLRRLLALGMPAGATILVEIAIFAAVTNVIATLGPVALAGHEIALNCISFSFMIPLGISAAASVRVGQAIGRGSGAEARIEARAAGWAAIALGGAVMLCASAVLVAVPHGLAEAFTHDAPVIAATVPLLGIAAVFQLFDGLQITAMGALRGAGDTKSALVTHLCSYWLMGMPLGLWLCFHQKMGARGLWIGLSCSLIVTGTVLLGRWGRLKIADDQVSPSA